MTRHFYFISHYTSNFTNDSAYPSLAVNGGVDTVLWSVECPAPEPRYAFDGLWNRIVNGN